MKAMFVDTGLEYPEVRSFVKTFENVDIIRPSLTFKEVINKYGYPFISKEVSQKVYEYKRTPDGYAGKYFIPESEGGKQERYNYSRWSYLLEAPFNISNKCCQVMKKNPSHSYSKKTGRKPFVATTCEESALRTANWIRNGCNLYDAQYPVSNPLSFWTEQDILRYIKEHDLPICSVYGNVVIDYKEQIAGQLDFSDLGLCEDCHKLKTSGVNRTGCMFCGYGCHLEKKGESRFEKMKITHPKQYDFIMKPVSEGGLGYKEIFDYFDEHGVHIYF